MKRLFTLLVFVSMLFTINAFTKQTDSFDSQNYTDYCNGWEKGYKEGYCYQVDNCVAPSPPVCPTPLVNQDSYQDGYNRGFVKGKSDR